MSFTYDLATDIGKVRLNLGDKTSGAGPNPDGSNISDEEITALLAQEYDASSALITVQRAVAAACEMLANAWASVASSVSVGARSEANQQSVNYAARAEKIRVQYGNGARGFSSAFTRNDGFALNASSSGNDYA
jgi:hypothetical protein